MPSASGLLLYNNVSPSKTSIKTFDIFHSPKRRFQHPNSLKCKAASSSIADHDLYQLLGVDKSSDQSEIKKAYRALQKRCHPDIAGPAGHDMAIILNEVYSLLSNPNSRYVYDKEQAKMADFRGYTGKPLYSAWFGSENEDRAVFVDEVKCVGCLKCALFAEKTFAVESVYGRARVVAQWADPEHRIHDAIESCPVDCISIVERSNLAALEFLMSKQPRGNVRVGASNTGGIRVSNIFVDVKKFQSQFHEMNDKTSTDDMNESDLQREARISAMQTIRSISNWRYWQSPTAKPPTTETRRNLKLIAEKSSQPNMDRLREAAARRRATENARPTCNYSYEDEYWKPTLVLPSPIQSSNSKTLETTGIRFRNKNADTNVFITEERLKPMNLIIPTVIATVSAVTVGLQSGERAGGGLTEHIGGAGALEFVNSSLLQVVLAGITWYLIGIVMVGLVEAMGKSFERK